MKMTATEVNDFIHSTIPMFKNAGCCVETVTDGCISVRQPYNEGTLRAGGSISGPTMMALADTAMYALILAGPGRQEMAVTSNLNIHFLARPAPLDLYARATWMKRGERQAVCAVDLYSAGDEHNLVAHATGTYTLASQKP